MKKIVLFILSLALILSACAVSEPGMNFTGMDSYKKELSEEEAEKLKKDAGNDIENRPAEAICYLTIDCHTALESGKLGESLLKILPEDGVLLDHVKLSYEDGESVFDVIVRAVQENKIHLEYSGAKSMPYIEGVANLYEFDCGSLSGWMYKVNGWSVSFGMGQYKVEHGDEILLAYTCDLGDDLETMK